MTTTTTTMMMTTTTMMKVTGASASMETPRMGKRRGVKAKGTGSRSLLKNRSSDAEEFDYEEDVEDEDNVTKDKQREDVTVISDESDIEVNYVLCMLAWLF